MTTNGFFFARAARFFRSKSKLKFCAGRSVDPTLCIQPATDGESERWMEIVSEPGRANREWSKLNCIREHSPIRKASQKWQVRTCSATSTTLQNFCMNKLQANTVVDRRSPVQTHQIE